MIDTDLCQHEFTRPHLISYRICDKCRITKEELEAERQGWNAAVDHLKNFIDLEVSIKGYYNEEHEFIQNLIKKINGMKK